METPEPLLARRTWLLPLALLSGACLTVFVLTNVIDAMHSGDPRHVLTLVLHPNPVAASSTLSNAGEIVAAVLAIAITVVAILVELASKRYTHRVTELFISEPINFVVMGLFIVTALQGLWVTMTFDNAGSGSGYVPYVGVVVSMSLLTICLLVLLPYFSYVFSYLNPIHIVRRIHGHVLEVIAAQGHGSNVDAARTEAVRGIEQLADVALNAMQHRDNAIAIASVHTLRRLIGDYRALSSSLPQAWFSVGGDLAQNPDFVSMDRTTLLDLAERRLWFEMKVLRQYQMVYDEALNRTRDLVYVIAIDTRLLAEDAMAAGDPHWLQLIMKFFNTYLRSAINAQDVRTAYNVLHQYRRMAEQLLEHDQSDRVVEVAGYFKYYGLTAFAARLPFVLEVVAYDLCALIELAHERNSTCLDELLTLLLRVDKESEGEVQEASLRGVRKAQAKLATLFLANGDKERAKRIYEDMREEDPRRLASIRDELHAVHSPEYWEITDRGANFDYIPNERREQLDEFFGWFSALPAPNPPAIEEHPGPPGGRNSTLGSIE